MRFGWMFDVFDVFVFGGSAIITPSPMVVDMVWSSWNLLNFLWCSTGFNNIPHDLPFFCPSTVLLEKRFEQELGRNLKRFVSLIIRWGEEIISWWPFLTLQATGCIHLVGGNQSLEYQQYGTTSRGGGGLNSTNKMTYNLHLVVEDFLNINSMAQVWAITTKRSSWMGPNCRYCFPILPMFWCFFFGGGKLHLASLLNTCYEKLKRRRFRSHRIHGIGILTYIWVISDDKCR